MIRLCAFRNCTNNNVEQMKTEEVSYFQFPTDKALREEWCKVVAEERGVPFYEANRWSFVCSEHFLPDDLRITMSGLRKKKEYAVPKLYIERDNNADEVWSCSVCLATDGRIYTIKETGIEDYAKTTGIMVAPSVGLPSHLCGPCRSEMTEGALYIRRSQITQHRLMRLRKWHPL